MMLAKDYKLFQNNGRFMSGREKELADRGKEEKMCFAEFMRKKTTINVKQFLHLI